MRVQLEHDTTMDRKRIICNLPRWLSLSRCPKRGERRVGTTSLWPKVLWSVILFHMRRDIHSDDLVNTDGQWTFLGMREDEMTSLSGNCSATSVAQDADPYPQSRTFFKRASGGNTSRPSKVLFRTLCWIPSLSSSS